jgi:uncharacterized membrane protein YphA (DoxX/SURF4 family)
MFYFLSIDPAVALIFRLVLALVFASAVFHKLAKPMSFRTVVSNYRLLPDVLVTLSAAGLVVLEGLTVIALVVPVTASLGTWIACGLLLIYTVAITINLARGRTQIDCGCMGSFRSQDTQGHELSRWLLVRNLSLLALALAASLPEDQRSLIGWDSVTIVFAVTALGMVYAAMNHLLATGPRLRALVTRHD